MFNPIRDDDVVSSMILLRAIFFSRVITSELLAR